MEVVRLKIKKLNGKYDFDIDLNRQCTIIVGANGVGKTTVLRMIEILNMCHFYDLLQFVFDEITYDLKIENTIKTISIRYEDLLPDISEFANRTIQIQNSIEKRYNFSEDDEAKLFEILQSLEQRRSINGFIYDLLNDRRISDDIKNTLVDQGITISDRTFALTVESFYEDFFEPIIFAGSKLNSVIEDMSVELKDAGIVLNECMVIEKKKSYFLSMVKKIELDSKRNGGSLISSSLLKWLNAYEDHCFFLDRDEAISKLPSQWQHHIKLSEIGIALRGDADLLLGYTRALRGVHDFSFERFESMEYIPDMRYEINGLYRQYKNRHNAFAMSADCIKDIDQIEIESLLYEGKININNLVTRFYYTDQFQISINERMCEFIADYLDGETDKVSDDEIDKYMHEKYRDDSFYQFLDDYVRPTISGFLQLYGNRVKLYISDPESFSFAKESPAEFYYTKFLEGMMNEFMDDNNINPKIKRINDLVKKYFYDKEVQIVPAGLKIFIKGDNENKKELNQTELSSGEIKVLVLLFVSTFGDDLKVYIDEPELSLSISWQEEILKDVISNGNCKIVVATHSPYMTGADELTNNVAYVPQ